MKEIGSEFWSHCSPTTCKEYYTMRPTKTYDNYPGKVIETLSGRTALEHIVELLVDRGKSTAYLPSYCCHTMIEPFQTHGMRVLFYDVYIRNTGIHRVNNSVDYDVILLMDYFGHIDDETRNLAIGEKNKGKTVIYDATHSMYSSIDTTPYDYVYGSYRKWVDINCGFLAWKEELSNGEITQNDDYQVYSSIRERLFYLKADFINGGATTKEEFLPLIEQAETILEEQYHHKMPDQRSLEVLKRTDVSFIKMRRMKNARFLTNAINDINDERVRCITPILSTADVPLFVPVMVSPDCRDSLKNHLIKNHIYSPVHWPVSKLHSILPGAKQLYESELSLICDQRYDEGDMTRIAETISSYLKQY